MAAGCLLTVSDVVVEGEFVRITDEEMPVSPFSPSTAARTFSRPAPPAALTAWERMRSAS